jgi:hypothetical protein
MRTVYVQRWTEDLPSAAEGGWEDFHSAAREANDAFIDGRLATSDSGGFMELATILGLNF